MGLTVPGKLNLEECNEGRHQKKWKDLEHDKATMIMVMIMMKKMTKLFSDLAKTFMNVKIEMALKRAGLVKSHGV